MAVRVYVRLKCPSGSVEGVALANAWAEAEEPVVAIPQAS